MTPVEIIALPVGPLQVNCFILGCTATNQALVVDPGDDGARILAAVTKKGWTVAAIVNTHAHFDHVGGNAHLVEQTGAPLCLHAQDLALLQLAARQAATYGLSTTPSPAPSRLLNDGDLVQVGDISLTVIHTPGHTQGGICLYGAGHLFSGDTLFADSVGRTDLPGGNTEQLLTAIRQRLLVLPDETVVHPGHGPDTTIGREKRMNPYVGLGA
jgi:hydroxyacylglutathione hydrolase